MNELQKAYENWVSLAPFTTVVVSHERTFKGKHSDRVLTFPVKAHYDGECCSSNHRKTIVDHNKQTVEVPLADTEVCPREMAWRKYTRIRDGICLSS